MLVVVEPWAALTAADLRALASAAQAALALETGPDVAGLAWPAEPVDADLVSALSAARDAGVAPDPRPMPAWGLPRAALAAAGGLDPALWSIGLVEDVRARLRDLPLAGVATAATPGGRQSAWPLDPALRRFLGRRNRLLTAFRTLDPDRLGVELAHVAIEALHAATVASGLTEEQFRFGGGWGAAEGALARLLRPGADGASHLADHVGTIAPAPRPRQRPRR